MTRLAALVLATLAFLPAAAAQAGTYHVYSCAAGGGAYANNAWRAPADVPGVVEDAGCAGGIGLTVPAGARMADNTSSALTFTTPAGTTIADFALTRQLTYRNPVDPNTHRYFVLYTLGTATHFAGAGNFADPTRNALNAQKHWYGYPDNNAALPSGTVSLRSFPALAAYNGRTNVLTLRAGCFARNSPCSVAAGGAIAHLVLGSDVTVNDPTTPATTVEASGLLAGGTRNGSDPVTVTATDNSGIRRVELLDVTNAAAPAVVGVEDYAEVRTDAGRICDYSLPAPCPSLTREIVRPTALPAGSRLVLVRVTDTGGNVSERGPYPIFAATASDRGPLNGAGATETATLAVTWATGSTKPRLLDYGRRAGVRGRLLNSAGGPIAGARVSLLTRDRRRDAALVHRVTLTTAADGTFRTTVSASASRLLQFAWASHANDIRFTANAYLTLRARADATLRVSTRRPRVGRAFTISGQLKGVSRGGVPVIVQGRPRGARRFTTFADTTSSSQGRFKVRYRFRDAASRGRSFVFRARIRPGPRFPYTTGYSRTVTVRAR
jgi:hypothetical protein